MRDKRQQYLQRRELAEFDHKYACWANNHNGWSKAKKAERKRAKKGLRRAVRKEMQADVQDWIDSV